MDRKKLILTLAVVVMVATVTGWAQQSEPEEGQEKAVEQKFVEGDVNARGEARDEILMEHWKSRSGRTWEQFIEEWMTPQPFPKKTAVKIDDRYAYPHVAAGMKMEIVREDEDTVWLRGLSPENPESPLYRLWARRQADEALMIAQGEIAQKPGAAYLLDYGAEEVPPPFMNSLDFELSGRPLMDRGRWQMNFAVADMNEDGHPDLVFPPQRKGYPVQPSIFLGDGKGGFKQSLDVKWPTGLPFDYGGVAAGDFNGDGHQDLVFAIHLRAQYVVWGNGTNNFTEFELLRPPDPRIPSRAATVADFDGNGQLDLAFIAEIDYDMATSKAIESAQTVWIQYRRGDSWELGTEGLPQNLIADVINSADMNGDGKPDLILSSNAVNWRKLVYLNRGGDVWEPAEHRGTLSSAYHYDVQPFGDELVAAFVQFNVFGGETEARNGLIRYPLSFEKDKWVDGKPILWNKDRVDVFFRLGVGDLDGNGLLDVVASRKSGGLEVYLQNDVGDFFREEAEELSSVGRAFAVRVIDLNGDGLDDIVACFTPQQDLPGGVRVWLTKEAG